jgi:hypothetical protein
MSEDCAIGATDRGVPQHTHVRLDLRRLVVGSKKFEAERRVQIRHDRFGFLPDHFVAAAGIHELSLLNPARSLCAASDAPSLSIRQESSGSGGYGHVRRVPSAPHRPS